MSYDDISTRQRLILEFIIAESKKQGYPPTVREICEAVGLSSPGTVHSHLTTLEEKGYIRRNGSKQRAIEIVTDDLIYASMKKEMAHLPVVGTITAGQPILAEEHIEDYFPIPMDYLTTNAEVFMLNVSGESMIEAGVFDGDLIMVEKTAFVRNGEMAVVLVEDSATVKYFYKEKRRYRLQPANQKMEPIYVDEAQVLGRVIGLFRRF